jgi:hypothetical protein
MYAPESLHIRLHVAVWCGASLDTIRLPLRSGSSTHIDITNEFG